MDQVLLKLWACVGLFYVLSKILLFTPVQAHLGINMITESLSLAEVFALLLCPNCSHVQMLLSKMVHQNGENIFLFSTRAFVCVIVAVFFFPGGRIFWEPKTFCRWTISLICRMICMTRPCYIPVDIWKGRLVYKTASCLEGEDSSFLQLPPNEEHNG